MAKSRIIGRNTISKTKKRILLISTAFLLFLAILLTNLFKLQVIGHEYYKNKVYDQITTTSALKAQRGNIYDRNMNLLATTNTEWRIFISTKELRACEKKSNIRYSEIISRGLADILGMQYESILNKIQKSNVLDVTIKKSASEKEYLNVLDFIKKNSLENLVFTEAQSSRYYPEQTLAAHVIGFTGSDNQGLYGLEYYYDDQIGRAHV